MRLVELLPTRVVRRLPATVAIPMLARRRSGRSDIEEVSTWMVDDRLRVDAYWLTFDGTSGPSLSVFFEDEEFLRVDCLSGSPHLHYCLATSRVRSGRGRVALAESNDADLIARACFELRHNTPFALHLDRRRSVQKHQVDFDRLDVVSNEVAEHLQALVRRHR